MEILQNLFRTLMFFLDNIVYSLIPQIYKLFIYLSELNLFGGESNPLKDLVSHIYVLLGIFMLFKVSFSLLQYLVDPNAFRDSSKGMGKLVTNVLVALVLLVSVPAIFSAATEVQKVIIHSNAIGQLILGTNATDYTGSVDDSGKIDSEGVEVMAKDLQFMLFGAFYSLNTNLSTFSACAGTSGVFGSVDMASEEGCLNAIQDNLPDDATSNSVSLYSFFKYEGSGENCNSKGVCDDRNFGHFDKLLWWKDGGEYVINYLPFISTAAGVYVVFLLISFSIDIAVRAIKLCFLQMVAPIAIVSYIDPKESISNGKLHNWIKECASTYFSLFLRLATIFLIMLLVSSITSTVLAGGEGSIKEQIDDTGYSIWIYLFLVIGAFMFAKQLPKIIENIFGLKGTGELSLNPFKNAGMVAMAGIGATAGAAVGSAAANTWAFGRGIQNNWGHNISDFKENFSTGFGNLKTGWNTAGTGWQGVKNRAKLVGGAIRPVTSAISPVAGIAAGAASGLARAGKAATTGTKPRQAFTSAVHATNEARYRRDVNQEAGYGVVRRGIDKVDAAAGVKNKDAGIGKMDKDIKTIQREMDNVRMSEQSAREQQVKMSGRHWTSYQTILKKNENGQYKFADYNKEGKFTGWNYDTYEKWYLDEMNKQSQGLPNEIEGTISIGRSDFNEFTDLQNSIDSMDSRFEELRQDQSRLKDASDARNNNGKE